MCIRDSDEDGLTIVKKLRAGAATKHLPVLMVTEISSVKVFSILSFVDFSRSCLLYTSRCV